MGQSKNMPKNNSEYKSQRIFVLSLKNTLFWLIWSTQESQNLGTRVKSLGQGLIARSQGQGMDGMAVWVCTTGVDMEKTGR